MTIKFVSEEEWKKIMENADSRTMKFKDLFDITCKKCESHDVEIFGDYDTSNVYYPNDIGTTDIVVKCHKCGNAKVFSGSYFGKESLE